MEVLATLFSLGGLVVAVSLAVRDIRRYRAEFAQCVSHTHSLLEKEGYKPSPHP